MNTNIKYRLLSPVSHIGETASTGSYFQTVIYKKITIERGENRCGEESFIRLGYITSRDLLNKGTAVFLRINYPDEFNRLAAAYPEIRLWV